MRLLAILMIAILCTTKADAQNILKGIGQRVIDQTKEKVENKVDRTVGEAADRVLDPKKTTKKKTDTKEAEAEDESEEAATTEKAPAKKTAQGEAVKSDFVPGTAVIFEDDLRDEQMGEFPSKWDLIDNNAEVAKMNGKIAIKFEHGSDTEITPLLEDEGKKYLPEVFTLEFDFFVTGEEEKTSGYHLLLKSEDGEYVSEINFGKDNISWNIVKPNGDETIEGSASLEGNNELNDWNHFALSFNKRALKAYINNKRVINIPNAKAMDWFSVRTEFWEDHIDYITNVRLAKGGVELYDRNAQSMTAVEKAIAETGKFVTNNILFDTGKATLKQESMIEIMKVAEYMKKNPTVRFEVQGHTDNQGSDAVNDPLSQQRAEAIVKALEGLGVDGFNLKAVGKGSHEPIADNKTEEGRAKNRRVEFIKK